MSMPEHHYCTVSETCPHSRLDKFLADELSTLSRSRIQSLIKRGCVSMNGKTIEDNAHKIHAEDTYLIVVPPAEPSTLVPIDIPLNIVFEDDDILIIDKPAGLTVHPGAGNSYITLANALLSYCGNSLSGIGGVMRPGIVHRLDKDTSGLMVVAKHDEAHKRLSDDIAERCVKRFYTAICWGTPIPHEGTIENYIGRSTRNRLKMAVVKNAGKHAITHYKVNTIFKDNIASLVTCKLHTGRTHQIRVHLTHLGHPLIGDPVYGTQKRKIMRHFSENFLMFLKDFSRQALHAHFLALEHPITGNYIEFKSAIPNDMEMLLNMLRSL